MATRLLTHHLPRILIRYVISMFAASIIIFVLLRLIPGDPASVALGTTASPEALATMRHTLGTDRPLPQQYWSWISGILHGNWGTSYSSGQDIGPQLLDRTSVSLILVITSMILALCASSFLGTWAALARHRIDGYAVTVGSQIGIAIPSFLAAIIAVSVISVHWRLLPANGWVPPDVNLVSFLARIVLPVCSLAAVQAAILTRYVRQSVIEVIHEDYIRTGRATGLSLRGSLLRHGPRNAFAPVITVTGIQMANLVVGAVVIEQVFVIPGLGTYLLQAISTRDMIAVQSTIMMLVAITLTITYCADLIAALIDPRTRGSRHAHA